VPVSAHIRSQCCFIFPISICAPVLSSQPLLLLFCALTYFCCWSSLPAPVLFSSLSLSCLPGFDFNRSLFFRSLSSFPCFDPVLLPRPDSVSSFWSRSATGSASGFVLLDAGRTSKGRGESFVRFELSYCVWIIIGESQYYF
jgi:hypothetical protein